MSGCRGAALRRLCVAPERSEAPQHATAAKARKRRARPKTKTLITIDGICPSGAHSPVYRDFDGNPRAATFGQINRDSALEWH